MMPKKKLAPIHIKRRFHILPWAGQGYSNSCYIQTAYIWLKANGYINKAKEKLKSYTKDGKIDFEKYYREFVEAKEKEIKEIEDKYLEIYQSELLDDYQNLINNFLGGENVSLDMIIEQLDNDKKTTFVSDIVKIKEIKSCLNEIKCTFFDEFLVSAQ